MGRIYNDRELQDVIQSWRMENKIIIFTNGCFDILHRGHVEYLNEAKQFGDRLIIGLNSDQSVKRLKGADRPIVPEQDRAIILANLIAVDAVVIFAEDTPYRIIEQICPHVLVKGGDYLPETIVGRDIVEKNGGKLVIIPTIPGKSSSSIIQKIRLNKTQGN